MSYILDALKKSDQQRQSADVPNLQTVYIPVTAEPQAPWGLYGFILLLLLALVFVIGMMVAGSESSEQQVVMQHSPQQATDTTESVVSQQNDGQKPVYDAGFSDPRVSDSRISDSRVSIENKAPANRQSGGNTGWAEMPAVSANEPAIAATSRSPTESITSYGSSTDSGTVTDLQTIPYLEELADYKQQSIPQLKFAGHVYSSTPANRSVIINGFAMAEGDIIVEGLVVEKITPNGVVFSFKNELFRMNILQDWSFE